MTAEHQPLACRRCQAALTYAPGSNDALVCQYCGESQPIAQQASASSSSYDAWLGAQLEGVPRTAVRTLRCGACGAETTRPPEVLSDRCPFCDSPTVTAGDAQLRAPDGVLPFVLDEAAARAAIVAWERALWFKPGTLFSTAPTVRALYLPYWSFDWDVTTEYVLDQKGAGAPARQRTQLRASTVLGSASVPVELGADLEPWDVERVQAPNPQLLLGVPAETHGEREGLARSAALSHRILDRDFVQSLGLTPSVASLVQQKGRVYHSLRIRLLLLPVWSASYHHGGKTYRVLVNGQSGEVVGERPVVRARMIFAALALLVLPTLSGVAGVAIGRSWVASFWIAFAVQAVFFLVRAAGGAVASPRHGQYSLRRPDQRGTENLSEIGSAVLQGQPDAIRELQRGIGVVGLVTSVFPLMTVLVAFPLPLMLAFDLAPLGVLLGFVFVFRESAKEKRRFLGLDG